MPQRKYPPSSIWCEATDAHEIEHLIMCRNTRHLQQATLKEGLIYNPIVQALVADKGYNDPIKQRLKGELSFTYVTDEAIQAWLGTVQRSSSDIILP